MTCHTTKELYAMFLESEFWVQLSRRKRAQVGKCERCGSRKRLQSRHLTYPPNWFDTTLEQLQVLCRGCHERAHGRVTIVSSVEYYEPPKSEETLTVWESKEQVMQLRSMGEIDRKQFDAARRQLQECGKWEAKPRRSRRRRIAAMNRRPIHVLPVYYPHVKPYVSKWSNRGSSSN